MIRYHYFGSAQEARDYVESLRAAGGLGYYVGRTCDEYEAREIV